MSHLIYDQQTEYSRLMVWVERSGIRIREWSDDTGDDTAGFHVHEATYTWAQVRNRERCYSGDDNSGRLASRLVSAAISLMGYYGPDSDTCGTVSSLREYLNGSHVFTC